MNNLWQYQVPVVMAKDALDHVTQHARVDVVVIVTMAIVKETVRIIAVMFAKVVHINVPKIVLPAVVPGVIIHVEKHVPADVMSRVIQDAKRAVKMFVKHRAPAIVIQAMLVTPESKPATHGIMHLMFLSKLMENGVILKN